ncbi:MAG: Eco57I restriction-modification methylase domain-containing protein [Isosphaeraceae bacterium]
MRTRVRNPFTTVQTSGLLLPVDLLARIVDGDPSLPGLTPDSYHLNAGERLNEAAARAWNTCVGNWKAFREASRKVPASDQGTTLTRDKWLLPLFRELGYGWLQANKRSLEIDGKPYPVSHQWQSHVPVHLVSFKFDVEHRTPGASGAAQRSPYSLVQEFLNRSAQHRWGFVSNGMKLLLLHDNVSLVRASNVEFDLEAMFEGEVYSDFVLLFALCHQSRVEILAEDRPEECWLEKWSKLAEEQGTRAREKLRVGVERALNALGVGFLTTRGNTALRETVRNDVPRQSDLYRELLRLVYRLILLLVAEDKRLREERNLLHPPDTTNDARQRYARFYSIGRLRRLADQRRGTAHTDLYESLKVLLMKLREGYAPLGVPGLGSELFSDRATPQLDQASLSNEALLAAVRHLCYTEDTTNRGTPVLRPVDFGSLGSEELGSIYESLLEMQPSIDTDAGPFQLVTRPGHERKTTSSYYTHSQLIKCVLDCALDPLVDEALSKPDPEKALLSLRICDPACGSGHFLIAAADRLAKHVARLRTGDDEPSLTAIQHAKRDVIARCVHGVDLNPMAVELCKVSLWMEALEPGKPLGFLDLQIQAGNSLMGATPALLAKGIPDDAFDAIEGDDRSACTEYRRINKDERHGQETMFDRFEASVYQMIGNLAPALAKLAAISDDTLEGVRSKQEVYADLLRSSAYENNRLLADAWCAAFVIEKKKAGPLEPRVTITEKVFRIIEQNPHKAPHGTREEIKRLARHYRFFHWHVAFPNVFQVPGPDEEPDDPQMGWSGGFDLVLGNPPWDSMSPDAKEFFSTYDPNVRIQDHREGQRKIIQGLMENPSIAEEWKVYCRDLYAQAHFFKKSGRYNLFAHGDLGKGDLNVYRMFVETALKVSRAGGWASQVVPEGLYNGANSMAIRQELFDAFVLKRVLGFENSQGIWFPGIHRSQKFCIYNARKGGRTNSFQVAFNIRSPKQLSQVMAGECLTLSVSLVTEFSPEALAIMEFGNQRDIDIAGTMYKSFPKFGDSTAGPPYRFYMREIDKETDRRVFDDNPTGPAYYEGRMVGQYDHRAKGYRSGRGRAAYWETLPFGDPSKSIQPQWYIPSVKVPHSRVERIKNYRIGFCDVGSPTNERTLVAALIPPGSVCAHTLPTITFHLAPLDEYAPEDRYQWGYLVWLAVANSFSFDFVVRQKVSLHVSYTILDSLPFPRLHVDDHRARRLLPLCLRLTCTGPEMTAFWNVMANLVGFDPVPLGDTPPGLLDPEERLEARARVEAIVAKEIFGLAREDVEYILETFPIVRESDIERYGDYRTKLLILEHYDATTSATASPR